MHDYSVVDELIHEKCEELNWKLIPIDVGPKEVWKGDNKYKKEPYNLRYIPTLILFDSGTEVKRTDNVTSSFFTN